jgi:pyruvate/2-oxoglutarate dehydrogenase complex dihydrolipoamide dehydrogenase (E3) component
MSFESSPSIDGEFDIAIIGAGSAGPKAARTAAKMGAKVVIFEEALIGGECLYTGCVPSKAVIYAASLWKRIQRAQEFGLPAYAGPNADVGEVMRHARRTIETVGAGSAVESFARAGITTVCERASFVDPHTVVTSKTGRRYSAKQFILCTGTVPTVPNVPGLEEAGYETNRNVFERTELPRRLAVLGGGPIGCELGQVFARFGSQVTLLHNGPRILARDDADAAEVLKRQFDAEGIRIITEAEIVRVDVRGSERVLVLATGDEIVVDSILVATGRRANVDSLNLEAAGVSVSGGKLKTEATLQTNVPHIWAAGDVTTDYKFTHVVSYEGAVASLNAVAALYGRPLISADYRVVPRVTYTDPEVASVGLTPALARVSHNEQDIDVARFDFADLDKAIILGDTEGFVQIVSLKSDGTILGAQIVGAHAGSLISEICLAMRARLSVAEIALTMHAYPTMPEAVEAAAYQSCHAPLSPNIPREMRDE